MEEGFRALEKQNERGSYMEREIASQKELHDVEVKLLKLEQIQDGLISAVGLIRDKQYTFILDSFEEKHKKAYQSQTPIFLKMYQKDGKLHCA